MFETDEQEVYTDELNDHECNELDRDNECEELELYDDEREVDVFELDQ